MPRATIWHNPQCSTSRNILAELRDLPDMEVEVVNYLKTPPTGEKLRQLFRDAGITPAQGLRTRGNDVQERGLLTASDDAILAAMVADPKIIERPIVETEKGVRLCRPPSLLKEIL